MAADSRSGFPFPLLVSLAAAVAGQILVVTGWKVAGALLFLLALAFLIFALLRWEGDEASEPDLPRGPAAFLFSGILLGAFFLRRVGALDIPWGLGAEEAGEGLLALRFLAGAPIAAFTPGAPPQESLYPLLLAPLVHLLGPGITPLRLLSLVAGLAGVAATYFAGRALFSRRVGIVAATLLAVSPWHLLFSRAGVRVVLLPLFVGAAIAAFARAWDRRTVGWFAAAGFVLGIGMHSHASFRVVPVFILLWGILRRLQGRAPLTWKETAAATIPFLILALPHLGVLVSDPAGYLLRPGSPLTLSSGSTWPGRVSASLAAPFFPMRMPAPVGGPGVPAVDTLDRVYSSVGFPLETVVSAALMACGLALAGVRAFRRRSEGAGILCVGFAATLIGVGGAGPSPSRLMGALPFLCLAGSIFLEAIRKELAGSLAARRVMMVPAALVLAAGGLGIHQYFLKAGGSEEAMLPFDHRRTLLGLYVASRPPDHPIYVFHTGNAETIQFLTARRRQGTYLIRDPKTFDLEEIRGSLGHQEFVMEMHRDFLNLLRSLGEAFPGGDLSFLRDPRHLPDRKLVCVFDVVPASRRFDSPGASPEETIPRSDPP